MTILTFPEVKFKRKNIKYNKCGHHTEKDFSISNESEYDNYIELLQNGINDYCNKCKAINTEYGMIKKVEYGEYDYNRITYVFNHTNIKKLVHYCYKNSIPLHDEHIPTNSPYDCTGKVCQIYVKVTKGKTHCTITIEYHRDL